MRLPGRQLPDQQLPDQQPPDQQPPDQQQAGTPAAGIILLRDKAIHLRTASPGLPINPAIIAALLHGAAVH